MHDPIETAAARMDALEHENAVIRANNAKLQAEVDRLRELSSGERAELHGLRALVAEINEVLGLSPAEPADARTTLDAARLSYSACNTLRDKLERSRDNSERLHKAANHERGRRIQAVRWARAMSKRACNLRSEMRQWRAMVRAHDAFAETPMVSPGLVAFFDLKAEWSRETFGPGDRYQGVVAHIRKELDEIEAKPDDLEEWVDVVLLAMDGAWRSAGADGQAFVQMLTCKDQKNRMRTWPDWRTLQHGAVIEHVKPTLAAGTGPVARPLPCYRCKGSQIVEGPGEYTTDTCPECSFAAPVGDTARKLATPEPKPHAGHTAVLPVALAFLHERAAQGRAKYGCELEAGNGRDAEVDALQEAGDFFLYQVQRHIERQHEERELARLTTLRPRAVWTEDDGDVLWWLPGDVAGPVVASGYQANYCTHWTPLPTVRP